MYQLNLESIKSNTKLIKTFNSFFKGMVHSTESGFDNLQVYGDKENAFVATHTVLPRKENINANSFEHLLRKTFFYKFEFKKSISSKFETSRVYGLKNKIEKCPDILLDKDSFKKEYKGSLIPEYNYDLKINCTKSKNIEKCFEYDSTRINQLVKHVEQEIKIIFEKYGEIEVIELEKSTILHIKNIINFYVVIELEKNYKLSNADPVYEIIPNYKLAINLFEGDPIIESHTDMKGKTKKYLNFKNKVKGYYFKVEFRYLDFIKNPNYFVFCMTPHGYIRLKKEYSLEFFNKIIYHYLFKKYFEKYKIDLSNEDLEKDPQSFFTLISMLKY